MGYVSQFPEKPGQQNSSLTCSFQAERRRESFVSPRRFLLFRHRCWMLSTLARTASSFFLETKKTTTPLEFGIGYVAGCMARKEICRQESKTQNHSKPQLNWNAIGFEGVKCQDSTKWQKSFHRRDAFSTASCHTLSKGSNLEFHAQVVSCLVNAPYLPHV